MDWVAQQWPMLVVLVGAAIAYGRHEAKSAAMRKDLDALTARHEELKANHYGAQMQLAKDLEAIRITLARIEASLVAIQRAA